MNGQERSGTASIVFQSTQTYGTESTGNDHLATDVSHVPCVQITKFLQPEYFERDSDEPG